MPLLNILGLVGVRVPILLWFWSDQFKQFNHLYWPGPAFPSLVVFLRIALIAIEQEVKKDSESWRKYLPFPSIKRISFNIHPVVLLCLIGSASPKDGSPPALTTTSLTHLVLQITHSLTHSLTSCSYNNKAHSPSFTNHSLTHLHLLQQQASLT